MQPTIELRLTQLFQVDQKQTNKREIKNRRGCGDISAGKVLSNAADPRLTCYNPGSS